MIVAVTLGSEIESFNIETFGAAIFHVSVEISVNPRARMRVMLTVAGYLFSQSTCYSNRIDGSAASCEHFDGVAVNLSSAQTSCCSPLGGMGRDILGLHRESPCAL